MIKESETGKLPSKTSREKIFLLTPSRMLMALAKEKEKEKVISTVVPLKCVA